ncbi:MAG: ketopantoate reductase family protein [Deltaproteobacteria bacterium]|nr:ketopantoate reductase family protein [Deltaproteobacteria bacterium]
MRIAIVGAGALGGFYGGLLARAGHEVLFIARGEMLRAFRESGLRVERDGGPGNDSFSIHPLRAVSDPAGEAPVDLVLFTTKTYGLEDAAPLAGPLLHEGTFVLPLLNGVDITERLQGLLGPARVLGGLSYLPANVPRPGVVRQAGFQNPLRFGVPTTSSFAGLEELRETLREAGINAELSHDIVADQWAKFVLVTSTSGSSTLTGLPLGDVAADPDRKALFGSIAAETAAVAEALGVGLAPDVVPRALGYLDEVPAHTKPSMLQDLERGRPLELESLQGTVVRLGGKTGVPTPVNRCVYAALKHLARGRLQAGAGG